MEESDQSDFGEDMLQMVDDDDIKFLKDAVDKKSYSILRKVKHVEGALPAAKRRKVKTKDDVESLENIYESQLEEPETSKSLLPIKTKKGIIMRSLPQNYVNKDIIDSSPVGNSKNEINSKHEYMLDTNIDNPIPQSTTDLLAIYSNSLRNRKIHIGYLCSSLLENPEERISNFRVIFQILEDEAIEASLSIKKVIVVSLLEVFTDILPSYQIKQQDAKNIKLKKDTLKLQKYEQVLLQYYKKFLQKLEKFVIVLVKKRGDMRKRPIEEMRLGEVALYAMCDLLLTHPYFNFSLNIVQAVIPFLNHKEPAIRKIVLSACIRLFKEDKKEEITLKLLRVLNQYLKKITHVRPDMLEILLHLKIKDVNLDQEKENEIKQKKLLSQKHTLLSKREKKRKKKLQDLEKEMLETRAEENKQSKQKNITEITKIVFSIYFRILKSSTNTQVLGVCLKGLTKFSHCINLNYYVDLLNMLNGLLSKEWLGYREQIHCVETVFSMLHDQGDSINLDPTRFYTSLYSNLLHTHASKTYGNCSLALKALSDVLIRRRKKITNKRTLGFVKRILTLSLQLLHNGSLGMLALAKQSLIQNKSVDILLDLDFSIGDGDYQPEINDPEYCNASSTALYELKFLVKHYHPIVSKFAKHIANGAPSTGEGSLPAEFRKSSIDQLFADFDMGEMAFNPTIKTQKEIQPTLKRNSSHLIDANLKECCDLILKKSKYSLIL